MVEAQRGRTPQFPFMKSSARSAVVFGSIVAGLSSGTGGGLTLDHSVVMSFAFAGERAEAATAANAMAQQGRMARIMSGSLLLRRPDHGQLAGAGNGTCIVMTTIGAPPDGMTWCGVFGGTISMSPFTTLCEWPSEIDEPERFAALTRFSSTSLPPVTMLPVPCSTTNSSASFSCTAAGAVPGRYSSWAL